MKRILVIDDSPTVRQQVSAALGARGYEVAEAVDGQDALDKLDEAIVLIICDVNMPRLNGIETLERLHADTRWQTVPVVMLTTEGQPTMIERAKKLGVKGWIVKPFKPDLLASAVNRLTSSPKAAPTTAAR